LDCDASTPNAKSSPSFPKASGKSIQAEATQGQSDAQEHIVSNIDDDNLSLNVHIAFRFTGANGVIYGDKGGVPLLRLSKSQKCIQRKAVSSQ
jgi:hypothetical protein